LAQFGQTIKKSILGKDGFFCANGAQIQKTSIFQSQWHRVLPNAKVGSVAENVSPEGVNISNFIATFAMSVAVLDVFGPRHEDR